MKSTRGWMMLLGALLAAAAAVVLVSKLMQSQRSGHQIAVAAVDVEMGARLSPEMLKLAPWPADATPPGAFTSLDELGSRVVKTSLLRGEPLIEGKLAPVGSKGGLSAVVAEGKRAMTVRVNDVVGVAGFALPGTYVDIMVNTQSDRQGRNNEEKAISKIVLERILVLAVAQEANRDETKPKVVNAVTLEVDPRQAELLDLARSVGTLSLVLRNQIDPKPGATDGATKATLFNIETPAVTAPAPERRPVLVKVRRPVAEPEPAQPRDCVEVIRGTARTKECF